MKAYIAGGCEEHGRNSFLIEGPKYSILIDCGILLGKDIKNPILKKEQIEKIRYIFLTHSHKDHIGALPWIYQQGFKGTVYLSIETYNQMIDKPSHFILINIEERKEIEIEKVLKLSYGRTGHCIGSLWFKISFYDKKIIFTGDYCEDTLVYACDPLRNEDADIAFVDCAYGEKFETAKKNRETLIKVINEKYLQKKSILLPVPKNGRNLELLELLASTSYRDKIYIDNILSEDLKLEKNLEKWVKNELCLKKIGKRFNNTKELKTDVLLVSDAQLQREENKIISRKIIEEEGNIIFTGHVYKGTYANYLFQFKNVEKYLYSVHQNLEEAISLCEKNQFKRIILTHCENKLIVKEDKRYFPLLTSDEIEF